MKKIFALVLIALFVAGSVYAAGPTLGYSGDVLGQGKYQADPHRIFRLVHVCPAENDTDGVASGSVVVWSNLLDDGISVETTTTSGDGRVAGVLVTEVVSGDSTGSIRTATEDAGLNTSWGWLQTYGKSAVNPTTAAAVGVTAGASVCAGGTAASVTDYNAQLSTTNSGILGCALDTVGASTAAEVFITCD